MAALLLLALLLLLPPILALLALVLQLRWRLRRAQSDCGRERRPSKDPESGSKMALHETLKEKLAACDSAVCDMKVNVWSPSLPCRYRSRRGVIRIRAPSVFNTRKLKLSAGHR